MLFVAWNHCAPDKIKYAEFPVGMTYILLYHLRTPLPSFGMLIVGKWFYDVITLLLLKTSSIAQYYFNRIKKPSENYCRD